MFVFQSNGRTQDLQIIVGGVNKTAQFSNYRFSTADEEIATAVRKNAIPACGIVDLTPPNGTVVAESEAKTKAVRGARMSEEVK